MDCEKTTADLSASPNPIDQAILAERLRIVRIIEAHRNHLGPLADRIITLIHDGADPSKIDELRPMGFWQKKD